MGRMRRNGTGRTRDERTNGECGLGPNQLPRVWADAGMEHVVPAVSGGEQGSGGAEMRPGMCETHVNEAVYCQVCHEELLSDHAAALKAELARVTAERDRHKEGAEGWRNALSDVRDELGLAAGGVGLSMAQEIAAIKAERNTFKMQRDEYHAFWQAGLELRAGLEAQVAALVGFVKLKRRTTSCRLEVIDDEGNCRDEHCWHCRSGDTLANLPTAAARLLAERNRYRGALEMIARGGAVVARKIAQQALTAAPSESPS